LFPEVTFIHVTLFDTDQLQPLDDAVTFMVPGPPAAGKDWLVAGSSVYVQDDPVPTRLADRWGLIRSSEAMSRVALNCWIAVALKETETVQLLPAVSVFVVLAQGVEPPFIFKRKFVVFDTEMFEMLMLPEPVLEIVNVCSDEVPPFAISPKSKNTGMIVILALGPPRTGHTQALVMS
jgi:hypothetical protein